MTTVCAHDREETAHQNRLICAADRDAEAADAAADAAEYDLSADPAVIELDAIETAGHEFIDRLYELEQGGDSTGAAALIAARVIAYRKEISEYQAAERFNN